MDRFVTLRLHAREILDYFKIMDWILRAVWRIFCITCLLKLFLNTLYCTDIVLLLIIATILRLYTLRITVWDSIWFKLSRLWADRQLLQFILVVFFADCKDLLIEMFQLCGKIFEILPLLEPRVFLSICLANCFKLMELWILWHLLCR